MTNCLSQAYGCSDRYTAPPFTLLPYPMRLNGAAHNPRAAQEAGALKGSGAPPPLHVSMTPRAILHAQCVRSCSHPLPCRGGECPPHIRLLHGLRHSPPHPAEGTGASCVRPHTSIRSAKLPPLSQQWGIRR